MTALWLEFVLIFLVAPVAFAVFVQRVGYRGAMVPVLVLLGTVVVLVVHASPDFDRDLLTRMPLEHPHVATVALRFAILGAMLAAIGYRFAPELFLRLPRHNPRFFILLALLYPMLSVIPQGLLWRVWFAYRYAPLLDDRGSLLAMGAATFALAHLVFRNWLAIAVTAVGGALFLDTYLRTQSMLVAAIEHGLYGVAAFTFGLGKFLYLGARWAPDGRRFGPAPTERRWRATRPG